MSVSEPVAPDAPVPPRSLGGGWWVLALGILIFLAAGVKLLWPFLSGATRQLPGDGVNVATYGFVLPDPLPETLVASHLPKDGLPTLDAPPMITAAEVEDRNAHSFRNENRKFLVSTDRVIGVADGAGVGAAAKCYPIMFLDIHEIVNDTIGATPILVTWSPLAACAAVYDRRLGESNVGPSAARTFGFSGLIYQSDQVFYDRAADPHTEALWSQLSGTRIGSDSMAKSDTDGLKRVPFVLTTWGAWVKAHPATLVLDANQAFMQQGVYYQDAYGNYDVSGALKFPVQPIWSDAAYPTKTHVISVLAGGVWKQYPLGVIAAGAKAPVESIGESDVVARNTHQSWSGAYEWKTTQAGKQIVFRMTGPTTAEVDGAEAALPCFLFAWYAQYPGTTDLVR
jgi:hypothetical protein